MQGCGKEREEAAQNFCQNNEIVNEFGMQIFRLRCKFFNDEIRKV